MRILYVTTISNTVNAFLIPHIKMLIDEGHQVDVAFNVEQEVKQEIIDMGCKVYETPFQRNPISKQNIKAYKLIKKIVKRNKYDLVHTHTPVASTIVRLACKSYSDVKIIYTAHGFHFFKGAPLINWLVYYPIERWLARYTDVLITINKEDYNRAKKFKTKKAEYVPGVGIDVEKFLPQTQKRKYKYRLEHAYSEKDFILIYVGELSYRKNQNILIEAVAKLKNTIPNIKLLLVGQGECYGEYSQLIKELDVEEEVILLGFRTDVSELMSMSDVVLSSSRQEGLPVNVMEAMATGLPLIVSNCRGNEDLVIDGMNGFVVDVNHLEGYINSIIKLYKNKEDRLKFGEEGLKLINVYSVEKIIVRMQEIYNL